MPRITAAQRARNHESIVAAAGNAFRARGVDAVGIDEVMRSSGLTHGGFYNHFASKQALAAEVFQTEFDEALLRVSELIDEHSEKPETALAAAIAGYLSTFHRDHPEVGCPSAAMVADAARHGCEMQTRYAAGVDGYLERIARMITDAARADGKMLEPAQARRRAMAVFAEMVGTMLLARAVVAADPALSDELLETNRRHLLG